MRKRFWMCVAAGILAWVGPASKADVWDVGGDNDNDAGSDNELVHGLDQVHDMAAQQGGTVEDVDWYSFRHACNASYEILLDGFSGELTYGSAGSPALETLLSDATTVDAVSHGVSGSNFARRITYQCIGASAEDIGYARVSHPACGTSCTSTEQYQIHFRDTTALIPRFNNSASQVTILILQNAHLSTTLEDVKAQVVAYDSTGTPLGTISTIIFGKGVRTLNLATDGGGVLAGKSGALKIVNDGPYGALAGKAVAVEPATGFTFDTPLVYKPH